VRPGLWITRGYEDVVEDVTDTARDPRGRWGEMRPKNRPSARTLTGRCRKHREPLAGFVGRLLRSGQARPGVAFLFARPVCTISYPGVIGSGLDVRYDGPDDGGPMEDLPLHADLAEESSGPLEPASTTTQHSAADQGKLSRCYKRRGGGGGQGGNHLSILGNAYIGIIPSCTTHLTLVQGKELLPVVMATASRARIQMCSPVRNRPPNVFVKITWIGNFGMTVACHPVCFPAPCLLAVVLSLRTRRLSSIVTTVRLQVFRIDTNPEP